VEGYERFGDASSGPLLPGDRGTIIEMQNGSSGEKYGFYELLILHFASYIKFSHFSLATK
jgi:hypothetical protein